MNRTKTSILTITLVIVVLSIPSYSALGITGNYQPDSTSYVCVVVLFGDLARQIPIGYCTGILLSPMVVLTAGHSCVGVAAASVCFDKGPIEYSIVNGQVVYLTDEPVYTGTPMPFPEYALSVSSGKVKGNKVLSSSDVGVIVLDEPVEGITSYAVLPQPGFVSSLPKRCDLRVVGYGVQEQVKPKKIGAPSSWTGTISCNSATVELLSNKFSGSDRYLKCTANPRHGKGGIAFGDSGGPVLYYSDYFNKEIVVAIHSYVNNINCVGVTYHCRLDLPGILEWINGFLPSPP